MDKYLTKKIVFFTSGVYILFLVAIFIFGGKCYNNDWCYRNVNDLLNLLPAIFLPLLPTFIFSLLTYFMREEVFTTWIKFAKWWVLASILLVLVMPSSDGSFLPVDKESVAVFMSVLFTILSLVIVATKFFSHKSEAK